MKVIVKNTKEEKVVILKDRVLGQLSVMEKSASICTMRSVAKNDQGQSQVEGQVEELRGAKVKVFQKQVAHKSIVHKPVVHKSVVHKPVVHMPALYKQEDNKPVVQRSLVFRTLIRHHLGDFFSRCSHYVKSNLSGSPLPPVEQELCLEID